MSPNKENRREGRRTGCNAEMEWTYFNRQEVAEGRLLNSSRSGGCIESPREAKVPSAVFLRLKRCLPKIGDTSGREVLRTTALAEVKWCQSLPGEKEPYYAIGWKYVNWY